jgi:hypothetical protein
MEFDMLINDITEEFQQKLEWQEVGGYRLREWAYRHGDREVS